MSTTDIVQKLWGLCDVLRDDGVTYHEYVTELTYLLFLKMAKETGTEDQLPKGHRWDDLQKRDGVELLTFYKKLLLDLGSSGSPRVQAIFANASTSFREARHLAQVVTSIDGLDWYSAKHEGLGDLYEGLLEKNANETKSIISNSDRPKAKPRHRIKSILVSSGTSLSSFMVIISSNRQILRAGLFRPARHPHAGDGNCGEHRGDDADHRGRTGGERPR